MSTVTAPKELRLDLEGMTCASCATRIEKKLNKIEGVVATVNYATEKARVTFVDGISAADLVATVEATGYTAQLPSEPSATPADTATAGEPDEAAGWRQRLVVSAVLAAPVVVLSMVPWLQFDGWQWITLTLASPVVVWGALPFHRAAVTNARHGAATMDTLVSLGTLAAWTWSTVALLAGLDAEMYFEVGAVITAATSK